MKKHRVIPHEHIWDAIKAGSKVWIVVYEVNIVKPGLYEADEQTVNWIKMVLEHNIGADVVEEVTEA